MAELHTIENKVRSILLDNVKARGNDRYLYLCYLKEEGYDLDVSVSDFLLSSEYPSFETIRRTRQKAQARDERLKPSEVVEKERKKNEQDFLRYARH